jgi:hypothetical protein
MGWKLHLYSLKQVGGGLSFLNNILIYDLYYEIFILQVPRGRLNCNRCIVHRVTAYLLSTDH